MLVFHAHLPFVRHPELNYCLEENWFFEAITETYLPLLSAFERLTEDQIDFRVTLSLTPTLMSMLEDPLLQNRYQAYLRKCLELAEKEKIRTWSDPEFHRLARWYQARFQGIDNDYYKKYQGNLLEAFRNYQAMGKLDILTCAATHGFLPLLQGQPAAVRAQVQVGVETYRRILGQQPRGIWLPECAYYPGLEEILAEAGLEYFILDTVGVTNATPRPPFGVSTPLLTNNGVAVFGREAETSRQVWCARTGYPGDPVYRDFYRDIGFDLETDYIRPYIDPAGIRIFTGFKYYAITGPTDQKIAYNPDLALEKARQHAGHFAQSLQERAQNHPPIGRPPLIVSAYDAELLGHWWFEGPNWLEYLLRTLAQSGQVQTITAAEYLAKHPENPLGQPATSSWGDQGYYNTWLNPANDWVYPHLYAAGELMQEMIKRHPKAQGGVRRVLNQALRELLLAQSSDWAFIMNNRTAVEYAEGRTREHLANLQQLVRLSFDLRPGEDLSADSANFLEYLEAKNNLFPNIDYEVFR